MTRGSNAFEVRPDTALSGPQIVVPDNQELARELKLPTASRSANTLPISPAFIHGPFRIEFAPILRESGQPCGTRYRVSVSAGNTDEDVLGLEVKLQMTPHPEIRLSLGHICPATSVCRAEYGDVVVVPDQDKGGRERRRIRALRSEVDTLIQQQSRQEGSPFELWHSLLACVGKSELQAFGSTDTPIRSMQNLDDLLEPTSHAFQMLPFCRDHDLIQIERNLSTELATHSGAPIRQQFEAPRGILGLRRSLTHFRRELTSAIGRRVGRVRKADIGALVDERAEVVRSLSRKGPVQVESVVGDSIMFFAAVKGADMAAWCMLACDRTLASRSHRDKLGCSLLPGIAYAASRQTSSTDHNDPI